MTRLIKRAQKRDPDAFTELMQSQMQNMYKTARALLYNDEDAADAISDTILACWEKLEQLQKPQFFRTWMTRILINKCNDILRQKKALCFVEEVKEEPALQQEYENVEWLETMNSLDEKYRMVMILHYVDGLKAAEISSIMQIPASTVRTRLSRGREQMAALYKTESSVSKTAVSHSKGCNVTQIRPQKTGKVLY